MGELGRLQHNDAAYRQYLDANPGSDVSFAEFHARKVVAKIQRGDPINHLGPRLISGVDWREHGRGRFESLSRWFLGLAPDRRVVDYGCGTFRLGYHFINYLDRGNYFGLDVADELLDVGREMLGEELLAEKLPTIRTIDAAAADEAVAFGADYVFSDSVSMHVHPDETGTYFGNLERITHKPGAMLWFGAAMAERPSSRRNLTWPLERFIEALPDLEFVRIHGGNPREEDGQELRVGTLEFRRP